MSLHLVLCIPTVVKTCRLCVSACVDPRGARLRSAGAAAPRGRRALPPPAGAAALRSETLPRCAQHHRDGAVRIPGEFQVSEARVLFGPLLVVRFCHLISGANHVCVLQSALHKGEAGVHVQRARGGSAHLQTHAADLEELLQPH